MITPRFARLGLCLAMALIWTSGSAMAESKSFSEFLKEYNAIEVLDQELETRPPSPDMILQRAELHLQMDNGARALSLLEDHGSFADSALEAQRLWLMAQALRLQMKHVQAMIHFSQAARKMDPQAMQRAFQSEPGLQTYWQSVATMWIWTAGERQAATSSGQTMIIIRALSQAQSVWPDNPFWRKATASLSGSADEGGGRQTRQGFEQLTVQEQTRTAIAQCLAAAALNQPSRVSDGLDRISLPEVRKVWSQVLDRLVEGRVATQQPLDVSTYPKLVGLEEMILKRVAHLDPGAWTLAVPSTPAWEGFQEELAAMPVQEALSKTFQELKSSLLSPDSKQALVDVGLSYAILAQDMETAGQLWNEHHHAVRPWSLRLAAGILGLASRMDCPESGAGSRCPVVLLKTLVSAAGRSVSGSELPFWLQRSEAHNLQQLARKHPLDMLLNYAADKQRWAAGRSPELARTVGLLYPGSALANQGLFFLARNAHAQSNSRLAWKYLQKITPEALSPQDREDYLLAKAGLEMELGREADSMQTYQTLLEKAPQAIPEDKKLKLALLAQRRGDWGKAQSMLEQLWESRQKLKPSLQAEILFWIAEGAQKQGQQIQALRHYLRVFWEYPEEHIWAVTALYRAALIYEQRGEYRVARKMLNTVVDRADRKSQKEAARQRIKGIEGRMAGSADQGDEPSYLF